MMEGWGFKADTGRPPADKQLRGEVLKQGTTEKHGDSNEAMGKGHQKRKKKGPSCRVQNIKERGRNREEESYGLVPKGKQNWCDKNSGIKTKTGSSR